jgi:hypothetical protein
MDNVEKGSSTVVLITKPTEGALKKTEKKSLNEELESIHLIFPGEQPLIDDGGSINIRKQPATWQSLWE